MVAWVAGRPSPTPAPVVGSVGRLPLPPMRYIMPSVTFTSYTLLSLYPAMKMLPEGSANTPRGLFSFTRVGMQDEVAVGVQDVPETKPAKFVTIPEVEILRIWLALASVKHRLPNGSAPTAG